VLITPRLSVTEVTQRRKRYYSFLGLVQTRLLLPNPTTAYIIIKEQMGAEPNDGNRGEQKGEFKGKMYQVVLQAEEKLSFHRIHTLPEI